jgi:phage-related protein
MKVAAAAMVAYNVITKVVSAATKVWTAIQWLFNAALLANPITWIIIGIVALIAIIVLCVKHWDKITAAMKKVWAWIKSVFAAGWNWLKSKISSAVDGIRAGVKKAFGKVKSLLTTFVSWYVGLPGRILRAVGHFARLLYSKGRELVAGLSKGVTTRWAALRAWIGDIKSKVKSRIGSTARTLYSAGKDLLSGMISGVKAMAGRLVSAVTGPIGDAVGKAKSLLGIHSPSRVFAEIGKFTMQGFASGVDRYARSARSAVEGALDPGELSLSGAAAGGGATVNITIQSGVGDKVAIGREVAKVLDAYVGAGGRVRVS